MDGRLLNALGVVAMALVLATSAGAATFAVNSTADAVDATPGNGTCATVAGTCTLRAAVQEANALAGADVITLPAGTFLLTLVGDGEDAAATGDLDVAQPLEITGAGQDATIIDGVAQDRVLHVTGAFALTLRALTVRNGFPGANPGGGLLHTGAAPLVLDAVRFRGNRGTNGGGVMMNTGGAVTITGSRFDNNSGLSGGAVAHDAGAANLEVRDTRFEGNRGADGGVGGALAYAGTGGVTLVDSAFVRNTGDKGGSVGVTPSGSVTIERCVFEESRATGTTANGGAGTFEGSPTFVMRDTIVRGNVGEGNVGGILVQAGEVTVTGGTVEDNQAGTAIGGLYLISTVGSTTIEDTVFRRNVAGNNVAGGVLASASGALTANRLTFEDNTAFATSGGAQLMATTDLTLTGSRFSRNTALAAPGGGLIATAGGALAVSDSVFEDNQALGGAAGAAQLIGGATATFSRNTVARNLVSGPVAVGGGLVIAGAAVTVENSTFSANVSSGGGAAIYTAGAATTVSSCTFVDNVAVATGSAILDAGGGTSVRGSVFAGGTGTACAPAPPTSAGDNVDEDASCGLAGPRDRSGIDPQLGPLQDNGGPTPTHEPLPGSPLIDGDGGTCPATDQRGTARPTDGDGNGTATCDVGAVEFVDECPQDPAKTLPGICGCGVADVDTNTNGALDCLLNAELKARIATEKSSMLAITGEKSDAQKALKAMVKAGADDLIAYIDANGGALVLADPAADLAKLAKKARKAVRKTLKGKGKALQKKQGKAGVALDALDVAVAVQP